MLAEQSEANICRDKMLKVLEELHAQAEVALCFVGLKHWLQNLRLWVCLRVL